MAIWINLSWKHVFMIKATVLMIYITTNSESRDILFSMFSFFKPNEKLWQLFAIIYFSSIDYNLK